MPFDFDSLNPILQYAVAIGVSLGVAMAVFFIASTYLSGFVQRVKTNERGLKVNEKELAKLKTDNETELAKLKTGFEAQLHAKEEDYSKKLDDTQEAFKAQLEIKEKEFLARLESVATNFATQLSEHQLQLTAKDTALSTAKQNLTAVSAERDEWKTTAQNLNALLVEVKDDLAAQLKRIETLEASLKTSNKASENQLALIQIYKAEIMNSEELVKTLTIEKAAMLEMMRAYGANSRAMETSPPEPKKETALEAPRPSPDASPRNPENPT